MKAKTIKAILKKKTNEWIDTIEDKSLQDDLRKNTIVTGGCIASMLLKEKVNDYDIYFRTKDVTRRVAQYYVKRFQPEKRNGISCKIHVEETDDDRIKIVIKSAGIASEGGADADYQYFESRPEDEAAGYVGEVMQDPGDIEDKYEETEQASLKEEGLPKYRPVFMSTNAITLSHRIQLVLRFYGEPQEIHKNYDFVHCTNYWTSWDQQLTLHPEALEALLTKELRYVGSKYPLASILRMRKFIPRGWTINAGQVLKMCWQLGELDLSNIDVLEDQLTGVDVAYFLQLIQVLKEKDSQKVNAAYLIEIVDRMF